MEFTTTIEHSGGTTTGIVVPPEVVEGLGGGRRPKVSATINGYTYRSSIAVMGGDFMIGVSAEVRKGAGVAGGDEVDIDIEHDTEPREVRVPADFAAALDGSPDARTLFDGLSYSNKRRIVTPIVDAKNPETRDRRIAKAVERLSEAKI